MRQVIVGIVLGLGLVLAAVIGVVWSGRLNVSADEPHPYPVLRFITWARERSIAKHAADIVLPEDLSDHERIRRGAGNYDAMCVECHLRPGMASSEIRRGLSPQPPELGSLAQVATGDSGVQRQFWIIKHGIVGSAMPAWSKGGIGDESIWDLVAFLNALPTLSPFQYRQLVSASDGHTHSGADAHQHAPLAPEDHGRHAPPHPNAHHAH